MSDIEFKYYKMNDYRIGKWLGGTTTEFSIYPRNAEYKKNNFVWRISSATVDIEESDFTHLPNYDRVLIVLEGEVVLAHKEKRVARLAQYEQDRFSGSYNTKSFGTIKDFNLIVRKGNQGFAEVLTLTKEYAELKKEIFEGYSKTSQGFYCTEGFCVVNFNDESCLLKKGELLVINSDYDKFGDLGIMGEGKTIWTQVYFNEDESYMPNEIIEEEEIVSEKIMEEGNLLEDLKLAAIISWSNFRGGKHLFKSLKNVWYDEELQKGINKLDRILLPFLILLIGFGVVGYYSWGHLPSGLIAPLLILWIAIDFLIINPFLYLAILPKPIKSHIKKISELTEVEKELYQNQIKQNRRADNILKKYEITGRNKYID